MTRTLCVTLGTFRGIQELSKRAGHSFNSGPARLTGTGLISFDVDEHLYNALTRRALEGETPSDVVTRMVREALT